ncbi:endocuticle structural glycoprotein SgAbd-5-like [Schistocerca nitens]|uniref:endocuticle structural glycoprotein SgAbd-5-like n=1 Tax=Schistocerca nitens TaxID=7011 RepID=UPI002118AEE3|nr:endocuticle structural glycoprotein SgAbd-5-like [Schistocerca nitens]
MKTVVILAALVAICAARPQQADPRTAVIEELTSDNIGVGPWSWGYRTSNGISQQEQGTIENQGSEDEAIAVRGSYSFIGADGKTYTITYVADRNGFQPQGDFLPKRR